MSENLSNDPGDLPMREMPLYLARKKVRALKIREIRGDGHLEFEGEGFGSVLVGEDWIQRHRPLKGWYFVVYADGYTSASPADAFVSGYDSIPREPISRMMRWFEHGHLPPHLAGVSSMICDLAAVLDGKITENPEKTAGMRKLLEAKDCFVRARIQEAMDAVRSPTGSGAR